MYFEGNLALYLKGKFGGNACPKPLYFEGKTVVPGGKMIVLRGKNHCTWKETALYLEGRTLVLERKEIAMKISRINVLSNLR